MPEIVQNQANNPKPPRRKKNKEIHNAVERHRKEKINAGINRIGELLPCSQALKQSKNMILGEAFRYISELKRQNDEMLLNGGDKGQAEEIKRLRHQLEDLRKESAHYIELLKANGINFLDDPTIHWKGKQRCAKVAKVTPTHLMSKGIIVYSNGNNSCPTSKVSIPPNPVSHLDKQPANAVTVQPACDPITLGTGQTVGITNGAPVNKVVVSSASSHIPVATLIPAVSKPCLTVLEQYSPLAPTTPRLNPSMNYITVQGVCPQAAVSTPVPQQVQPDNPIPSLTSATCPTTPLRLQHMLSLSSLPQVVISNSVVPVAAATEIQSVSTILPASSTLHRTSATSSTQTTWTTLQLAGNTVQPVSQALVTDGASISHNPQQLSVCSAGTKHLEEPTSIHLQPQAPVQLQAPTPTCIPVQPSGPRPPQIYSAVVPCPQRAVAQQSSILSVPAIVSQAVVVHQPVETQTAQLTHPSTVRAQPALLPKPQLNSALMATCNPTLQPKTPVQPALPCQPHSQSTVVPQAQSAVVPQLHLSVVPQAQPIINPPTQPALVPQPQAATLPVLQTMQLLQVNSEETPVAVTSSPPSNSHVVILQQGGSCPAPQVLREDVTSQTPCQHIVIIQAPTLTPAPQSHHTAIVSTAAPTLSSQTTTSNPTCTASLQAASAKQLVHILPRPSTQLQAQAQAPQTITVNGQVYVLQPAKSPDKGSSQAGQSVTQILQPTCEEPTSNVAMNCLGALTSLSQSISKVSSQSNVQIYSITPPSYTTVQPLPVCGSEVSPSTETVLSSSVPVPSTAAGSAVKILPKKGSSENQTKQVSVRRSRLVKRKEPKAGRKLRRIAVKSKALVANDTCSELSTVATGVDSVSSLKKDTVTHDVNTQRGPAPNSVSSTCSSSAIISVSSPSEKSADSSVTPSVSIAKPTLAGGEVSNTKAKSTDDVHLRNNVTVSIASTVSSTQGNVVVSTNYVSLSKEIFTPEIGPQLNCSAVSAAPSSQCSSVDTVGTLSVASSEVHVNPSCNVKFFSETTDQNKVSNVCTSSEGRSTESRPSFTESSPPLTTVNSAQNNSKAKSVHSDHCQPPLPSDISTPSQPLGISANSTESGPMVSIMPSQAISRTQDKFARRHELTDSSQNQTSFIVPSTSTSGSDTSMSTQPVQHTETSRIPDPFKSLKRPSTMNMSMPSSNQGNCADFKLPESNMNTQPGKGGHSDGGTGKDMTEIGAFTQKETIPPQQVCTLENDSFDPPLGTSRQTDSPLAGGSGGRGFSVASLLPAGHNINASSSTFGAFTFTSEQAEILAMAARAIFEQDSPGKRTAGCGVDNPTSTAATGWDLPKMQPAPSNKDSVTDQQVKLTKQADLPVSETSSQVSARVPPVEPLASSTTGIRLPQSIAYSQSQPSAVTSLNVNNLIRPSSNQPYPGSPNLAQQVSAPSSGGATVMVTQSSSQVPPTCSGPNEYAPLKNALMRTHVGIGIVERHQKEMPKRSAQDDLILPNKRSKPCPTGNVARVDIKATDHVQMMVGQMPSSTSAVMPRNHSDGVGALFSGNTFMSTVLRPTEGHCSTQVPTHEQTQPSVVHLQQGHAQHNAPQSGQNLGGNPYLKHQQEQRHLYQLHHHLTQPESQIHSIHQRNLLQDQHVQKKRGVVRGGQTGPNVGLQKHHLEKSGVQHQQQQPPQQHQQQQHPQQSQQHQQQQQHHQQQQSQQKAQQIQQQQQSHQQQQQMPPQNSHSRHQHLQQQIQQQQQHFGARQDKNCEAQQAGQRTHQNNHLGQPERPSGQDHGAMQRLMGSRSMEQQQLTSQASNSVSRSSDLACTSSRQERHRLSSYSAEALIGKTPATGEQRMGVHLQGPRSNAQDQSELRGYVDSSRGKGNITHNSQSRLPPDHANNADSQRIPDCGPFKALVSGHQLSNFEVQVSRSGDMSSKSVPQIQRGPQPQTGFRMGAGPTGDGRSRGTYSGPHPVAQGVHIGAGLTREQEGCHQSFMQSLLAPHIPEQNGHQRAPQGCTPGSIEYNCVPGTSAGELQAKSSSPNLHPGQKAAPIRLGDNSKGHISQVSANLHGPPVRTGPPHPPTPHSSSDTGRTQGSTRSLSVSQRPHHIGPDPQSTKIRPGDRPRSGNLRPGNPFEPEGSLPLPSSGGVILGRAQTGSEARRSSIVRFMADGAQVSSDNNLVSDRCAVSDLTQNFGFPFIAEGGMNPPPPINANASFIPPVTQPSASRTPALLPVEPQNTLPSFYPSYSPAAHPSLPSEIPLQYFSNQMFTSPSTDKTGSAPLNNRFGSILSPPRPVGFAQASFPLLTDIAPMPIANSSGITPHLSNFNLTSLFPEIATAMPPDGSSMPMSPLLSLANTTSSDSNKQSNRPAHNISHILGHDGTSAV